MRIFSLLVVQLIFLTASAQRTDPWLENLLRTNGSPLLKMVLDHPDSFQYQVIYTRIDRKSGKKPTFTDFFLNVDRNRYFNPASTVKLPTALAALEKIHELKEYGIDKYTAMITDSSWSGQEYVGTDTTAESGLPSIAQYIKRIFLISDNDAYNRLYEFAGQQDLNERLNRKGYTDVRITRRFVPMSEEENRHTNAIRFMKNDRVVYLQQPAYSHFQFDFSKKILMGKGHFNWKDSLIMEPMDFTTHNNLPLEDLHLMIRSVMFPESVPESRRFLLDREDMDFLHHYMSALPSSSVHPTYDTTEYFDSYAKFFFKSGRQKIPVGMRIFNKPGWSYGFLTDAAYVQDEVNGIDFLLSAVIYVNSDGILNDNKYEYEQIGYPFFHDLFQVIYDYEKSQKLKVKKSKKSKRS
jgi:hypothetical protein